MVAGVEIFNEDNHVQLTGEHQSLCLVYKREVTLIPESEGPDSGFLRYGLSVNAPDEGLLFVGNTNGSYVGVERGQGGKGKIQFSSDKAVTFNIYIFDKAPIASSEFGFQSYSSSGELIFDSGSKILRVTHSESFPGRYTKFPSVPDGEYAVSLGYFRRYFMDRPNYYIIFISRDTICVDRDSVRVGQRMTFLERIQVSEEFFYPYDEINPAGPAKDIPPILIADVRGY